MGSIGFGTPDLTWTGSKDPAYVKAVAMARVMAKGSKIHHQTYGGWNQPSAGTEESSMKLTGGGVYRGLSSSDARFLLSNLGKEYGADDGDEPDTLQAMQHRRPNAAVLQFPLAPAPPAQARLPPQVQVPPVQALPVGPRVLPMDEPAADGPAADGPAAEREGAIQVEDIPREELPRAVRIVAERQRRAQALGQPEPRIVGEIHGRPMEFVPDDDELVIPNEGRRVRARDRADEAGFGPGIAAIPQHPEYRRQRGVGLQEQQRLEREERARRREQRRNEGRLPPNRVPPGVPGDINPRPPEGLPPGRSFVDLVADQVAIVPPRPPPNPEPEDNYMDNFNHFWLRHGVVDPVGGPPSELRKSFMYMLSRHPEYQLAFDEFLSRPDPPNRVEYDPQVHFHPQHLMAMMIRFLRNHNETAPQRRLMINDQGLPLRDKFGRPMNTFEPPRGVPEELEGDINLKSGIVRQNFDIELQAREQANPGIPRQIIRENMLQELRAAWRPWHTQAIPARRRDYVDPRDPTFMEGYGKPRRLHRRKGGRGSKKLSHKSLLKMLAKTQADSEHLVDYVEKHLPSSSFSDYYQPRGLFKRPPTFKRRWSNFRPTAHSLGPAAPAFNYSLFDPHQRPGPPPMQARGQAPHQVLRQQGGKRASSHRGRVHLVIKGGKKHYRR